MKKEELPTKIPVFPLNNFIIFPGTTVPLNIFEPRYIEMVDECMKGNRIIGMIQPKKTGEIKKPNLYEIGCIGKITSFNETRDGRYLIILSGLSRFKIVKEIIRAKEPAKPSTPSIKLNALTNKINKNIVKISFNNKKRFKKGRKSTN